jgi:N-acetylgalactosamine 4-sulfate 6-O-sulfotransferase
MAVCSLVEVKLERYCVYIKALSLRKLLYGVLVVCVLSSLLIFVSNRKNSVDQSTTGPRNPIYTTEETNDVFEEYNDKLDQLVGKLRSLLPSSFWNKTANPCWIRNNRQTRSLSCLPSFFLMGYPKCGTTELYNILSLHPQFAKPVRKEPHWWRAKSSTHHIKIAFQRYVNLFNPAAKEISMDPRKITADCSASTAWRQLFDLNPEEYPHYSMPYVLSKLFPRAKYVAIVRNPVSHVYSRFWYNCKLNHIVPYTLYEKGPAIFEILINQHIDGIDRCLKNGGSIDRCAAVGVHQKYLQNLTKANTMLVQERECGRITLADSLYYVSLKEWFKFVPRDRILVLKTEDMANDTVSTAQTLFKFLGMSEMDTTHLERGIRALEQSNSQSETHNSSLAMTERAKEKLEEFFKPYNEKLANLLHDDRFLWK